MINIGDIKALQELEDDKVALVMDKDKVEHLHELIGKVRHLIASLPDPNVVLKVDFEVQILSQKNFAYQTELKVGLKRTRIDALREEGDGESAQFWPLWDDQDIVFDSFDQEQIFAFVQLLAQKENGAIR